MLLADFKRLTAGIRLFSSAGKIFCALVLLLVCVTRLQATTVAEYRERVQKAILVLNNFSSGNESGDNTALEARATAAVGEVRVLLPPTETVVVGTGSLAVNNRWLHEALADYEKARANPPRGEMLKRIAERLQSLDDRLRENESASATNAAGKDQNKARLAEILQRSEYQKKPAEGGALARLWQWLMKWLAKLFPKPEPLNPGPAATISKGAQIFVVALALAVIAYVGWKLAPAFFRNRKPKRRRKRQARIVLGERLEPDQTAGDLLSEAEALARAGDLRAAIRKAYIALLCELGDRKIIRLAQHKTNRDYLRAVREIGPLHDEMRKLTNTFENHWYGFAPATENEWNTFRSGYQRAVTSYK